MFQAYVGQPDARNIDRDRCDAGMERRESVW